MRLRGRRVTETATPIKTQAYESDNCVLFVECKQTEALNFLMETQSPSASLKAFPALLLYSFGLNTSQPDTILSCSRHFSQCCSYHLHFFFFSQCCPYHLHFFFFRGSLLAGQLSFSLEGSNLRLSRWRCPEKLCQGFFLEVRCQSQAQMKIN